MYYRTATKSVKELNWIQLFRAFKKACHLPCFSTFFSSIMTYSKCHASHLIFFITRETISCWLCHLSTGFRRNRVVLIFHVFFFFFLCILFNSQHTICTQVWVSIHLLFQKFDQVHRPNKSAVRARNHGTRFLCAGEREIFTKKKKRKTDNRKEKISNPQFFVFNFLLLRNVSWNSKYVKQKLFYITRG